jgi:hypothetical protein
MQLICQIDLNKPLFYRRRPRNEFEKCFGKIVISMTPINILQLYPIRIDGNPLDESYEEQSNTWLLPVLNQCLKSEKLQLFFTAFYSHILALSSILSKETTVARKKIYDYLLSQFWGLFPACHLISGREEMEKLPELLTFIEKILSEEEFPDILPVLKGVELIAATASATEAGKRTLRDIGEKLMPKLVKHVVFGHEKSKRALGAISSVARSLKPDYLDRVFLKNIQKLIEDKNTGGFKGKLNIGKKS